MKYTKIITGLIITFTLTLHLAAPISYALTAEQACTKKKETLDKAYKLEDWNEAENPDQNDYADAFEEMQVAYHDYIGCIFNFAEKTVMMGEKLIDWNKPDQACLKPDELSDLMKKTEPSQLLGPILDAYTDYKNNLSTLGKKFDGDGQITDEDGEPLPALQMLTAKSANTFKRRRQMEIDSSLLAIDLMFTSLKELRLSFVMHVHFQCTLGFLDKYRRALEDLRNVIEPLPGQLEDASIS